MDNKEQLCIIKINENIRAVENDEPLTLSLSELKNDCRFMKFYNDFYNQKKRVENSIRKKICKYCSNSFEIDTMMNEGAKLFCSDKCRNKSNIVSRKKWTKEYYQEHESEIKAKQKEYYQRPEIKAKKKEYNQRPEIKAKQKEYNQEHESEIKAKQKEYYQEHESEIKAKKKERYYENKQHSLSGD